MDRYHLWFDLRSGASDLELAEAVHAYLEHLRKQGLIESHTLERCKLGFRPDALGEWHVSIQVNDLTQLQGAFDSLAPRTGDVEQLHAAVWSKVENLKTGLWRDFPDDNRQA